MNSDKHIEIIERLTRIEEKQDTLLPRIEKLEAKLWTIAIIVSTIAASSGVIKNIDIKTLAGLLGGN